MEHRAWGDTASSGQKLEVRDQRTEDRGRKSEVRDQRKEERDSPVGAAFSRDLAVPYPLTPSTNQLIP